MTQRTIKTAILGAGLAGLAAAHILTQNQTYCTIFEAAEDAGGCMRSKDYGTYRLETLYHHCFSGDKTLFSLMESVHLKDELLWLKGSTGYVSKGKLEPVTTPTEILRWSALSITQKARLAFFVLSARKFDADLLDTIPAETYLKEKVGEKIYNAFFAPLLKSKFGDNAGNVSAAWLMSRIAIRSDRGAEGERLGYLKGGWHRLTDALVEDLRKNGCEIRLNTPVSSLRFAEEENKWYVNGEAFDCIISTLPLHILEKISETALYLPRIPYQGAACLTAGISRDKSKPLADGIYWTNMGDIAPYGAVVVHTNFAPYEWYKEQVVYLASYFTGNPADNLKEKMLTDFCSRFGVDQKEITHADMYIEPLAGPVFTTGYKAKIPQIKLQKGLYAAGMFSKENYPERSMEGSVAAGFHAAELLLEDMKEKK